MNKKSFSSKLGLVSESQFDRKNILIAAGGTGGHIFPALAVANQLQKQNKINIIWFGSKTGMENRMIPKYGYPLTTVNSVGLRGKSFIHLLKSPFLLTLAFWQTIIIFIKFKPKIVLGMGGFSAGLAGIVAWIFRTPLVIHEQNAIAGSTNKILAKFATQTYQAFSGAFPAKINAITSGNPVFFVPMIKNLPAKSIKNVLIVGGSLGAQIFNETIPQLKTPLNIIHQSGKGHLQALKRNYQSSGNQQAEVIEFIDDMASLYAWADVVICRAGAMTISELMLTGCASILVPYPYAIDNHQTANAKILSNNQAAILLPQNQLTADKLDDIIQKLSNEKIQSMQQNAKELSHHKSAEFLAEQLIKLI